jgi:hypothetical protein
MLWGQGPHKTWLFHLYTSELIQIEPLIKLRLFPKPYYDTNSNYPSRYRNTANRLEIEIINLILHSVKHNPFCCISDSQLRNVVEKKERIRGFEVFRLRRM